MTMRHVLIWQWGRRGAMPRFALELAQGCDALPDVAARLSLSTTAEIMPHQRCDEALRTYTGALSGLIRLALWPMLLVELLRKLRRAAPQIAICVHAGPLDPVMAIALRLLGIPFWLIVHDAVAHPGDNRLAMRAQRLTLAGAAGAIVLSAHVESQLRMQNLRLPILRATHPPFSFGPTPPPPRAHGGTLRLLFFGRLLPYKGLNLLAEAVEALGTRGDICLCVVGLGAETAALRRLRGVGWVQVQNRWVPEAELANLLGWADAVVLPYTEASQSGVAAAAMAAGRWVIATRVGGLSEQCAEYPGAILCTPSPLAVADAINHLSIAPPNIGFISAAAPQNPWAAMAARLLYDIAANQPRDHLAKC